MTQPAVPASSPEFEWINIDGQMLPFQDRTCACSTYPVCVVYEVGRCKKCGVQPTAGGPDG